MQYVQNFHFGFPIKTIPDYSLRVSFFDFGFIKFVFRISGSIKFWDEDFNTGGPSLFAVRMEYVFAFQFWYCELCMEN